MSSRSVSLDTIESSASETGPNAQDLSGFGLSAEELLSPTSAPAPRTSTPAPHASASVPHASAPVPRTFAFPGSEGKSSRVPNRNIAPQLLRRRSSSISVDGPIDNYEEERGLREAQFIHKSEQLVNDRINKHRFASKIKHRPKLLKEADITPFEQTLRNKQRIYRNTKHYSDFCQSYINVYKTDLIESDGTSITLALKETSTDLLDEQHGWGILINMFIEEIYYHEQAFELISSMAIKATVPVLHSCHYYILNGLLYTCIMIEWKDHLNMNHQVFKTLLPATQEEIMHLVKQVDSNLRRHHIHHNDLFHYKLIFPTNKKKQTMKAQIPVQKKHHRKSSTARKKNTISGIHWGNIKLTQDINGKYHLIVMDWGAAAERARQARGRKKKSRRKAKKKKKKKRQTINSGKSKK